MNSLPEAEKFQLSEAHTGELTKHVLNVLSLWILGI